MDSESDMSAASSPRAVIGCLTAGFDVVGHSLLVVALPVVVDLVLWLGPQVSVAPLLGGFVDVLASQPTTGAEVAGQVGQATKLIEEFGRQFNLLSLLGGLPLLHVPSLLSRRAPGAGSPLGEPRVVSLSSVFAMIPWWGALILAGLGLGFIYLNEIAHQIGAAGRPGGESRARSPQAETRGGDSFARAGGWKFVRFLVFALGLMVTGFFVLPLWLLIVALGTVIAQPLGILFWVAGVGLASYVALHLIFVVPGLLLGGRPLVRAISESVVMSHVNLSSVLGLVVLVAVIYEGLGYAWSLPASDSWALLVGIVGNAFVATGLTAAAFVFYRDRLLLSHRGS